MGKKKKRPFTDKEKAEYLSRAMTVMAQVSMALAHAGLLEGEIATHFSIDMEDGTGEKFYIISVKPVPEEEIIKLYSKEESDMMLQDREKELGLDFMTDPIPEINKMLKKDHE